jgi:hypothetical protein
MALGGQRAFCVQIKSLQLAPVQRLARFVLKDGSGVIVGIMLELLEQIGLEKEPGVTGAVGVFLMPMLEVFVKSVLLASINTKQQSLVARIVPAATLKVQTASSVVFITGVIVGIAMSTLPARLRAAAARHVLLIPSRVVVRITGLR